MQSLIGQVITGLDGVKAYLNNILVGGTDLESCKQNLESVFARLKQFNLTISPEKCSFFKESVVYLGHVLSSEGIKADPEKTKVIKDFKRPSTLKELRSFLGIASYYRKFCRNFAHIASPLTELTKGYAVGKAQK